mmetsp:Transcript_148709/g.258127  ORF Transcript_148709/g.258127 Transcript_148709/m.258127 type:complete len:94 (-) Transcript_148709:2-283(-)
MVATCFELLERLLVAKWTVPIGSKTTSFRFWKTSEAPSLSMRPAARLWEQQLDKKQRRPKDVARLDTRRSATEDMELVVIDRRCCKPETRCLS